MSLPSTTTPEELAERMGWSQRRVRALARELGACLVLGNRMTLTETDVAIILEACRPCPSNSRSAVSDMVERVADAIERYIEPGPYRRNVALVASRLAIEAMREPTEPIDGILTSDTGWVVQPGEAAIVTTEGMTRLMLLIPNLEPDAAMPELVLFLTACYIRGEKDGDFRDEQLAWMESRK